MPTYEYAHKIESCGNEWAEWKSITKCFPTPEDKCPKCGATGNIELQVSGGSGRGRVELGEQEYRAKIKQDAKDYKREVYQSEEKYANIIGPEKYNHIQTQMDKNKGGRW